MTNSLEINASISELPIFASYDYLFSHLKDIGIRGIELVTGFKSRWSFQKIKKYSDKYLLPVQSIHQPPWSMFNLYFDENFIPAAMETGAKIFVFHPLPKYAFSDYEMKSYLDKLAKVQKKYNITIALENMPKVIRPRLFKKYFPFDPSTVDPLQVSNAAQQFGLQMTLDTSHAYVDDPTEENWFNKVIPHVANIHLSNFSSFQDHLPLDRGQLHVEKFMQALCKKSYSGLVTLEIFYPKCISYFTCDFEPYKNSIGVIREMNISG